MTKQRICSRWQNAVGAGGFMFTAIGLTVGSVGGAVQHTAGIPLLIGTLVIATGLAVVAVRIARCGVYWRPGGLLIRGAIRTYSIDRHDIRGLVIGIPPSRWGRVYAPVIVLNDAPPGAASVMLAERKQEFMLWWLSCETPEDAQWRIDEINEMISTT